MLIDDEKDFTELIGTLLGFHNLDVDTLNDPAEVAESLSKKKYALIVTDLMMPDIDGFSLIRELRRRDDYREVPVIVISAKPLTDEERKFLFQNKIRFLPKPFDPHALVEEITRTLGASSPPA